MGKDHKANSARMKETALSMILTAQYYEIDETMSPEEIIESDWYQTIKCLLFKPGCWETMKSPASTD